METKIKAIHFDVSDRLTAFINKKSEKMARRFEAITEIEVTLKVVKPETAMNKEASVKMIAPPAAELFASKTADTFEEAVDLCMDALERKLEKNKNT
ncbi:MAG: ribosome-associated translation inhibitor RaiA [Muribaculaceae bacterium]|nr:ribosome-associated translation inhibitor RaiA [Muribaculaceae bacterium]